MRLRHWGGLLFAAACVSLVVRGCGDADPGQRAGSAERSPASEVRAPSAAGSPRPGGEPKAAPRPPRAELEGRVVRVRDGDSIVVMRGGLGIEVRLDGIDCPELAQAFGRRAKRHTSDLAFGKTVRLAGKGKDRYHRELAEVFLPDGRSLNRELVAAGLAWWYRRYSTDRGLESLEQDAREARRGLWADEHPVPPWEFREGRRVSPGGRN